MPSLIYVLFSQFSKHEVSQFRFIELLLCSGISEVGGDSYILSQYCSGGVNENNKLQHATDDSITEEMDLFSNNLQLNND